MRYRRLNSDGDITFGNGDKSFHIDTPDAVGQAVATRLKLWVGEWMLDQQEGTPYQIGALGMHKKETIDPMIRERILETPGVVELEYFDSFVNPETRHFTVSAGIKTVYGATTIQEVL